MPPTFIYNPQRDASKAIRGFYYQIELTVVRWLELEGGTLLMCECGEDIDHVSRLGDADAETQCRILEQVKLRERITLRSQEALLALARFLEAVDRNPGIHLLYRFSTTATAGRELGPRFPRLSGIAAWEAVRRGELTPEETAAFVEALKALVADFPCPPDLDRQVFSRLQRYVSETDAPALVDGLVRPFEWATGLSDPPRLLGQIHDLLLEQQRANTAQEAEHLGDVLLVHVLRLLTAPGEKILTVEALDQLLRERSLTELDRRLLTGLKRQVEMAEAHLARLSSQVDVIMQGVMALQVVPQQLDRLIVRMSDVDAHLAAPGLPPPDEPPLVVGPALSRRRRLMQKLAGAFRDTVWLSIEGASGMGKTYAAKLLADAVAPAGAVWISLRGERLPAGIQRQIDLHLLRHVDDTALVARYFTGDLAFSELATHAVQNLNVLVVDELPDLLKEPVLAERLLVLSDLLSRSGGKLVTTTSRGIPQRVVDDLGARLQRLIVPSMDAEEIEEILLAAGAPSALREPSYLEVIRAATHGHPLLVSAVVAFLQRNSWRVGPQQLIALVTGDVARELKTETVRKVASLVCPNSKRC